ncbi:MAG: DEAD/DEAH box helicase [Lachnospiraceae bacterium]|nr:DEAD/DEAH box helicase [Lachnospiraceae bacterium]
MMKSPHGNWTRLFDPETLSQGKQYCDSGKAKKLVKEYEGYSLVVRGERNYRVEIGMNFDEVEDLSCSCSDSEEGMYCKHMAAGLFYLERILNKTMNLAANLERELDDEEDSNEDKPGFGSASMAVESSKGSKPGVESASKTLEGSKGSKSGAKSVGMAAEGKEGVKSLPRAQKKKPGKQGGGKPDKSAAQEEDLFSDLDALQKQELSVRTVEGAATAFVPSDYRYFHSENFLPGMKTKQSDRKKAGEYLRKNKDAEISVKLGYREGTSSEDMVGEATLSGETYAYYSNWTVRLTFNRDHILSSTCSGWSCSYGRYYGNDQYACEHQIAAIMLLDDYLKKQNPGDSTNLSGVKFLRGIAGTVSDAEVAPTLTIVPYLTMDENGMFANFRAGAKKLYKVKDLREFKEAMRKGGQMTFGSKTTLTLGRDHVLPESIKWLDFIDSYLQDEDYQISKYTLRSRYGSYGDPAIAPTKDRVDIDGTELDSFFETAVGDTIEFTDKTMGSRTKSNLFFQDGDLSVTLKIEANRGPKGVLDGIIMTGDLPEMMKGIRHRYFISEGSMYRISEERSEALGTVLDAEHGGYVRIMIGRGHLSEFYHKVLPALREIVNIETDSETEAAVATILPPEPEYVTYFDVDSGALICRCDVYYDNARCSLTDVLEDGGTESYRNWEDEVSMRDLLGMYFTSYDPTYKILFSKKDPDLTFDLLDRGIPAIMQRSEVRMTDRFKALKIRNRSKFDVGLSVESSLLDLSVTSSDLSSDELLDILFSYKKKKKYVTLKNGDFFKLDENESIARLSEMMDALHLSPKEFVTGKTHIPAYRALYLDRMLESSQDIYATRDAHFKSLIKEFKTIEDADFIVPSSLKGTLRKYQTVGYRWLRTLASHNFGGILADDMGLGKTLQVISVLLADKNENAAANHTSLVVTPASLVYNWKEEIDTFAGSLRVTLVTGTQKERAALIASWEEADVLVTSYDLLKRDITEYEGKTFRFLVADEAQYIKNRTTAAAKSLKLVRAETKYALTGTPIENRLGELWSIFDYLMPGLLYSYEQFREGFEAPIVKGESEEAMDQLRKMVTPFILRRKKDEVLKDLPDKLEEVRFARMESKQQKLYDGQVVRMRKKLQSSNESDFRKGKIEILAELMHIRQICCDPSLMFEDYDGKSAKREMCLELIESLIDGGHRALIFSQFAKMLEKLEEDLKERGIEYFKITGSTPKEKRVSMVKAFNEGDVPIFLISLKAGGTGLNLIGADVVIHYDPWWNLAVQDQATDRAHRIGQTKVVNVYKLIVKGTIEEKILEMQKAKRKLADDILQAEGVASAAISREELLELLS